MNGEDFARYGIDYEKGLRNCMSKESFYKKILAMFLEDPCFANAKAAFESKNYNELFKYMHELKGVCGNAAFADLYTECVLLVDFLRTNKEDGEKINELFLKVEEAYTRACDGMKKYIAE